MKINNLNILSLLSLIFLASCADKGASTDAASQSAELDWDPNGIGFAEFIGCTKGPDFSRETLEEMSQAFSQLNLSADLMWSGGYSPVEEPTEGPEGWWENNWTSEEAAKAAWDLWSTSEEAKAWSDKYSNVLVCGNDQIFRYEGYFQAPESSSLKNWSSFVAAEMSCQYNEGKSFTELKSNIKDFRAWLMENNTGEEFSFGAYVPTGEDSADFWWYNWHGDFEAMARGITNWEENGKEMQAKFEDTATCTEPTMYNGMEFYRAQPAS